ncbi:MAG: hypothetical protein ACETWM_13515 [Candidatus Lokiarchaeia archaeon]
MSANKAKIQGEKLINLVEQNQGKWKTDAIFIVDINFKVWAKKGDLPDEILDFFSKFPFREMHIGDTVHNNNTYMMKVTEKTAVLIGMEDSHIARLSAINLKGRINALSPFYTLEKYVEAEGEEPYYSALYTYDELKKREKTSFILDKTILRVICDAGKISLSQLRQRISALEELLGERFDLAQIRSICDRYVREGLIKQI